MSEGLVSGGYGDRTTLEQADLAEQTAKDSHLAALVCMTSEEIAGYIEYNKDNLDLANQAAKVLQARLFEADELSLPEHNAAANRVWAIINAKLSAL